MKNAQSSLLKRFLPFIIFAALVVLLAVGLTLNPKLVPSPLIGKSAPDFELPLLLQEGSFSDEDFIGEVTLLNVFASWCISCSQEHVVIEHLVNSGVRVVGFNYKDDPQDAKKWLAELGNPYYVVMVDPDGRAGIDWGVFATPETFLIDKEGIVRHKVVGPLTNREKFDDLMAAKALLTNE